MRLSPFFGSDEFSCHDGTEVPQEHWENLLKLAKTVTIIRRIASVPLAVISGYRTPAWNTRVGGAKDSTHLTAEGGDFQPGLGMTVPELHSLVLRLHREGQLPDLGGLGLYKSWCHIDVRQAADGHLRRWTGSGVGSEQ